MEAKCIRQTGIPHTTRLFADYLYHFDRVSRYFLRNPHDPEVFRKAASEVEFPASRRAALVEALRRQNGGSDALSRLSEHGTVAVVTGQQVGLFSGPAYTIYKALTAAKLAKQLSATGVPAVPVFWLATEDHDLEEVNHTWVFDSNHRAVALRAATKSTRQTPVGRIKLKDPPLGALRQALKDFPFGGDVVSLVERASPDGTTFGASFSELLKALLGRFGFLFLDPLDEGIRAIATPLLVNALDAAPELSRQILARNSELIASQYHAQVHFEDETSLFFRLDGAERKALKRRNGQYSGKDLRLSAEQLRDAPEQLSPNALLRPVVQDYILPTVSYIAGPAELAYLAQSDVLYRGLLGRAPVILPRSAFTLLDHRAGKLMARYDLEFTTLLHGEELLRDRIAQHLVPPSLKDAFQKTLDSTSAQLQSLREQVVEFDPTLAASLDKSRAKMLYQLEKCGRKVAREALRRSERAGEEAQFLSSLVYPHKHLQERFYSILPFLAKHGLDLLDRLYENVHLGCPDHIVLEV